MQFATMLINRTTLNNKLKTEQPSQKFRKCRVRKGGRVDWLVSLHLYFLSKLKVEIISSAEIANPNPSIPIADNFIDTTPTTFPFLRINGPPLLPGLTEASVCIK